MGILQTVSEYKIKERQIREYVKLQQKEYNLSAIDIRKMIADNEKSKKIIFDSLPKIKESLRKQLLLK